MQLPAEEITYWWIILGFGVIVALVVILLLSLLISLVKVIDRGVVDVRNTLRATKANTANTVLITQTGDVVDAVLAEGLQHHLFLGRALTGAGTPVGKD
jgi:hypothetical protein